jgi:hypothetical protein
MKSCNLETKQHDPVACAYLSRLRSNYKHPLLREQRKSSEEYWTIPFQKDYGSLWFQQ